MSGQALELQDSRVCGCVMVLIQPKSLYIGNIACEGDGTRLLHVDRPFFQVEGFMPPSVMLIPPRGIMSLLTTHLVDI